MAGEAKRTMTRLHRDITEMEREPLQGIQYHLHEGDMTHMCLILSPTSGPFRSLRLHLDVKIPESYPQYPPKVSIQTKVHHPNVYGSGWICCDILRTVSELRGYRELYDGDELPFYNGGYTPAYLLKYVFLQLLSFFSTYTVEQDYKYESEVLSGFTDEETFRMIMREVVMAFKCGNCGFNITVPSVVDENSSSSTAAQSAARSAARSADGSERGYREQGVLERQNSNATSCALDMLVDDCWLQILQHLSDQDMYALSRASSQVKELVKSYNLVVRRQLVCYYLRKTFTEAVLGIGLHVQEPPQAGNRNIASGSRGAPATIRVLDLFSHEAFEDHKVRTGIYGERFNVFLPVALDKHHFLRAEPIIQATLQHVHRVFVRPANIIHGALCIVEVLPRLMNGMVLDLVKDCDDNSGMSTLFRQRAVKKASEKALQGYCLLLHLFTMLAKRYPAVEAELRRRVIVFRQSASGRHKDSTPNIGEFLTYLLVLKEGWQTICVPFVDELLARNVVWFLEGRNDSNKKYPHLAHLEDHTYVSLQRLRETLEASLKSMRLVMFQVSFLRLAQDSESEGLNSQYGYPSVEKSEELFHEIRRIYAVKDWDVCMSILGFQLPATNWRPQMCEMLKNAVSRSQLAKYHVIPYSPHGLYYLRVRAEPTCPPPSWWKPSDIHTYHLAGMERQLSSVTFFPGRAKR